MMPHLGFSAYISSPAPRHVPLRLLSPRNHLYPLTIPRYWLLVYLEVAIPSVIFFTAIGVIYSQPSTLFVVSSARHLSTSEQSVFISYLFLCDQWTSWKTEFSSEFHHFVSFAIKSQL